MISIRSNRFTKVLDTLSGRDLAIIAIAVTVVFAIGYWQLSVYWPKNGLITLDTSDRVTFLDGLYFSIVTEATLGYGDIRPIGLSRFLACIQVFLGLALAGITIAKLTSLAGRELRLAVQKASGDWIEVNTMPSGEIVVSIVAIFSYGSTVRYDGENFDQNGGSLGFFRGEIIDVSDNFIRFYWSNRESGIEDFDQGISNLMFVADIKTGQWIRYQGTAHDFGKVQRIMFEGFRASEAECRIIHGTDFSARRQLVRKLISNLSENV